MPVDGIFQKRHKWNSKLKYHSVCKCETFDGKKSCLLGVCCISHVVPIHMPHKSNTWDSVFLFSRSTDNPCYLEYCVAFYLSLFIQRSEHTLPCVDNTSASVLSVNKLGILMLSYASGKEKKITFRLWISYGEHI